MNQSKISWRVNDRKMNYSKIYFTLILGVVLFMSSCKVGEKYKQPELPLPEEFTQEVLTKQLDSIPYASISWEDFFHDTTLIALIDSALKNNHDMQVALKNIDIAHRTLKQNRLEYLPSIDGNVASAHQQYRSENYYSNPSSNWYDQKGTTPPNSMYLQQSQFSSGLDFSWELDIWGKIANQKDELTAEFLNTQNIKNGIQTRLIADIAKGYFNLMMLDAQIEVAKRNVQLSDSTLHMVKLQFEAGEITALAVEQTESQRLDAASLVPELEKEIAVQENALRVLTGELDQDIRRSDYNQKLLSNEQAINLGAPIDIVRNRPDIRGAEFTLIAANARMNIKQSLRYPTLTLGGAFGVNSMLPKNWFEIPGSLFGNITGGLTAPIFQKGRLKAAYDVAKLEREKAEIELQKSVLQAVAEVSNAVVAVDKIDEQLDFAKKKVENSRSAVNSALMLFRSGYATYLEVITAQSNALKNELALVDAQQKQLYAYVSLYKALGGGWQK